MTSYASRKMILQLFLVIDMETEKGGLPIALCCFRKIAVAHF